MAFTWTNLSETGGIVKLDGIQEMEDNCDWLDDNAACINHKSVDLGSNYTTDDTSYYIGVLSTNYSTALSFENIVDYIGENTNYDITDVSDNAGHYISDLNVNVSGFCSKLSCAPEYCCMGTCTTY